jgi:glyoxylase-like metal-dependent hydrolase (beta-lactamase superfamily II)
MIKQISKNVWQFYFGNFGSNCYLVKTEGKNILIDTSGEENRKGLIYDLKKTGINLENIDIILLTHFHYDHIGNIAMFKNARVYASKEEISDFSKNPFGTVLNENFIEKIVDGKKKIEPTYEFIKIGNIKIESIKDFKIKSIKTVKVPGHTKGSIAFFMPKEKILFSGDTLFEEGIGRTDLPTSEPEKMKSSLKRLQDLGYDILCAGH